MRAQPHCPELGPLRPDNKRCTVIDCTRNGRLCFSSVEAATSHTLPQA